MRTEPNTFNAEQARFNMIEQQIRPWSVLDEGVLETLAQVYREHFVPASLLEMAFADVELPIEVDGLRTGECMLSPKVEARMLQTAAPLRHETVLEIGTGTGYGAALYARHARQVTTVEIVPAIAALARANLKRAGVANARVVEGDGAQLQGSVDSAFDVIVVSGSVHKVPGVLLERLRIGGRLVAIAGDAPAMHAIRYRRDSSDGWDTAKVFDTNAARLKNFKERSLFEF